MTPTTVTRHLFESRYSSLGYQEYLSILEEGNCLLNDKQNHIAEFKELNQLRAIRIALEFRLEVLRQYRKNQLRSAGMQTRVA